MSNKEMCFQLINEFDEQQLAKIVPLLQSVKNLVDEISDDAFCVSLYNDYRNEGENQGNSFVSIEELAQKTGIILVVGNRGDVYKKM